MFRCPDPCKLDYANCERWITSNDLLYGRALGSHGCNHSNRNTGLLEDRFAARDTTYTFDSVFGLTKGQFDLQNLCRA